MAEANIVLRNCGESQPTLPGGLDNYQGLEALKKARQEMTPEQVISEVKASGLAGRGGAGFPCGVKWESAVSTPAQKRYFICNADEGEVGAFKDRYIIENDSLGIVEGVAIAAYALGVKQAFIYLRSEYRRLLGRIEEAVSQIAGQGLLGDIEITVRVGAGAYVCGEESALMNSIEGLRGESRIKPPFPSTAGLFGAPTIINNVETVMNLGPIIINGGAWFSGIGTERSKGSKVFSVSGDVPSPGVYELVMGSSLRELVVDLAGAGDVGMIQVGGASGRLLPQTELDRPLAFESILGAGAVTVFNEKRDPVSVVHRIMEFFAEESCGKCAPCREGTETLRQIFSRLDLGLIREGDLAALPGLCQAIGDASLCGLGQSAPIPVQDLLRYFPWAVDRRQNYTRALRDVKPLR